jgi:hypothetical protein
VEEVASDFHAAGCRGVAAENVLYDGDGGTVTFPVIASSHCTFSSVPQLQ